MAAVDFNTLVAMQDGGPAPQQDDGTWKEQKAKTPSAPKGKAPPVMLAQHWDGEQDPAGWWVSEKFDGVRAWWDGEKFLSRQGNIFAAPSWFTTHFPRTVLDGELWLGRRKFQQMSGIARGGYDAEWKPVKYMVFDQPHINGGFEQRQVALHTEVQLARCPWLEAVAQIPTSSSSHLRGLLAQIEKENGEGLIIRRPGSAYDFGMRSSDCLKVITVQTAEAAVTGYTAGKGNRIGVIGALVCVLPNGIEFKIGTGLKRKDLKAPPPVGTLVTFGYKGLTEAGVPREPRFVRVRTDLT